MNHLRAMNHLRIELKGWAAVAVLVLVVGFLAFRLVSVKTTLASEAADALRAQLRAEYSRELLEGLDVKDLDRDRVDPRIQEILDAGKIEFASIGSRGLDPVYVRVEVRVAGDEPPDGKTTRYFVLSYSTLLGWTVRRETSALWYYLHLF